jgi:hypothetical protein
MPLVDYSSSESEEDKTSKSTHPLKRKRPSLNQESSSLPPLPASFHDLYSTNTRTSTSDDPALHGGRKRQIPHVQGNWPSHVYLDCEFSNSSPSKPAYPIPNPPPRIGGYPADVSFEGIQLLQKQAFSILLSQKLVP